MGRPAWMPGNCRIKENIMANAKRPASSTKTTRKEHDAIALLTEDHKRVRKLFKQFEKMKEDGEPAEKEALARQICEELKLHTEVEEKIFYPSVREAIEEEDMLDEALVEHASAKDLIAQIEDGDPKDGMWAARVSVLGEYVEHHVTEEEEEMFPKAKKAKLDLEALGEQIEEMKASRQAGADGAGLQVSSGHGSHAGSTTRH
jgi:hemerythrin-like domain-containing protein